VLIALVAVGMYSRSADARHAASRDAAPSVTPAPVPVPAAQDVNPPAPQTPQTAEPTPDVSAQPAPAPAAHAKVKATPSAVPDPNAPPPIDLDALEHEIDQLTARAGSVNSGLDGLRAQQARDGLGLRGDIAQRQESMKLNVQKAQDAITRGDGVRAKRYTDLANADVEALEKFLGR
jgi:hypothetical protein